MMRRPGGWASREMLFLAFAQSVGLVGLVGLAI